MTQQDVRDGEALDLDALGRALGEQLPGWGGPLKVRQFRQGHSNLTYLIYGPEGRQLVLRRGPHGASVKSGHDMSREFRILSALSGRWDKAPRPLWMCEDESVIGAPFYVMERVDGEILRGPGAGVRVELDEASMRRACDGLVRTLAEIHGLGLGELGLEGFGRPQGYVERQVSGWTQRWIRSATDTVREMDDVAHWLAQNQPEDGPASLIHNDFKYDNVVYDAGFERVTAVLDWEMATVGDRWMDLGTALAYWVEPGDPEHLRRMRFGPTMRPGNLTRQGVVDRYVELTDGEPQSPLYYYVYGLFKIAVVGQQIYYRYKHGHTQDERFAGLIIAVQELARHAASVIDTERLSG